MRRDKAAKILGLRTRKRLERAEANLFEALQDGGAHKGRGQKGGPILGGKSHQIRSMASAIPCPPPMHMVTSARRPPVRRRA